MKCPLQVSGTIHDYADPPRITLVIPQIGGDGLLPPGRHSATLAEVHDVFVRDAPNHPFREQTYQALDLHLNLMASRVGPGTVWIDGGFTTYKTPPPHDVDLVYMCRNELHLNEVLAIEGILQLITLQTVIVEHPVSAVAERLQPVGGLVDAFLATPRTMNVWHAIWSAVKGDDGNIVPGAIKGYVEVEL